MGTATPMLSIQGLTKTYASGQVALKPVDLEVRRGEILALLGPNGAGKTTLISIVCGLVTPGAGRVRVDGHDILAGYRETRARIGLVPQELHTDMFETVLDTVRFSRGLFGLSPDPAQLRQVLESLSLWDKRDSRIMALSGGMKRRLLIAKALAHEPCLLFLDEPTAGVDVELRRDMWGLIRRLRDQGMTIVLTTHYIEEAEEMADRVGVIHKGELLLVEETAALMKRLGRRTLRVHLVEALDQMPEELADWPLELEDGGTVLSLSFSPAEAPDSVPRLLGRLNQLGLGFADLHTSQSSLEEIFVELVREPS
ncbi:MAG: ABC transporter ATP-binding protein [Wenzhouxiangella sp.]|nr:ABC transporter ATP-binding protein [Wenzhouxiangella sp.]MCH8477361.1 ABC transporter ATP-binding protein [Wenzhouxiangella sp.]TVR94831.1 MAG: ABC transporter ATP-binding protein [Wenzhouxiangellaceae bacterium]